MATWVSGNIFIRSNELQKKGQKIDSHAHIFDHTTIIFIGSIHVKMTAPDGTITEQDFKAPSYFLVRGDTHHEITALEDGTTYWCVYAHCPNREV